MLSRNVYQKPKITQKKIKLSFFLSNVAWLDQFNLTGNVYAQSGGTNCTDACVGAGGCNGSSCGCSGTGGGAGCGEIGDCAACGCGCGGGSGGGPGGTGGTGEPGGINSDCGCTSGGSV